jgi:hypothetical protein
LEYLSKINTAEHFKLPSFGLKFIESLALCILVLKEFLLLSTLLLDVILQPLDDLFLSGNLLLGSLYLLLQDLLSFLSLC